MFPLLRTKLFLPTPRTNLVLRPRLEARLEMALAQNYRVVLVSAAAGSGKTTLLASWIALHAPRAAWLSLDGDDNDPANFWRYFAAALGSIHPDLAEATREFLQPNLLPPPPLLLTYLANAIAQLPAEERLVLVLDDYHLITNQEIHSELAFLFEHQPPQLLMVIATRTDPPLPINRMRAKGQLVEVRAADLRFTLEEAQALVKAIADLDLPESEIRALETRTEGWAVGLQLAALSIQGRADYTGFLSSFSGSFCYSFSQVIDYLTEEVLNALPERIRRFMLKTSVLESMCAELCEELMQDTEIRDSTIQDLSSRKKEPGSAPNNELPDHELMIPSTAASLLTYLYHSNLFVIPLDSERRWYRYHHLFSDLLRARLKQSDPEAIARLHRSASEWYQRNGFPNQAVHHALAAGDSDLAARLVLEYWKPVAWRGEVNTALAWLDALPPGMVQANVLLGTTYAWLLNLKGRVQELDTALDKVKASLEQPAPPGSEADWASARLSIGPLCVTQALRQGDYAAARGLAEQVLSLVPEAEIQEKGMAYYALGNVNRAHGDLAGAEQAFSRALQLLRSSGNQAAAAAAAYILTSLKLVQGDLMAAEQVALEAFAATVNAETAVAVNPGEQALIGAAQPVPSAAQVLAALSEVRCQQNRLAEAAEWATQSYRLARQGGHVEGIRTCSMALARAQSAQGYLTGAVTTLEEATRLLQGLSASQPASQPAFEIAVALARVQVRVGNVPAAVDWADRFLRQFAGPQPPPLEYARISVARVRIAQQRYDEALELLAVIVPQAEGGRRVGHAVEALLLQALAFAASASAKDDARACLALERALTLAAPGPLVRPFLDEGAPLLALIRRCLAGGGLKEPMRSFALNLLELSQADLDETPLPEAQKDNPLVEPLTSREGEILQLLSQGLSNQQIADRFVISLPTVKKHVGNIYGKLGVTSRTQAIARARELGII